MRAMLVVGLLAIVSGLGGAGYFSWLQVCERSFGARAFTFRCLADLSFAVAIGGLFATIFAIFFNASI